MSDDERAAMGQRESERVRVRVCVCVWEREREDGRSDCAGYFILIFFSGYSNFQDFDNFPVYYKKIFDRIASIELYSYTKLDSRQKKKI